DWEELNADWGNTLYDTQLINDDLYMGTSEGLFAARDISEGLGSLEKIFAPEDHVRPSVRRITGDDHMLVAATLEGGLHASEDNGESWYSLNAELTGLLQFVDMDDGEIYATKARKIFVGKDYGNEWMDMDPPLSTTPATSILNSPFA